MIEYRIFARFDGDVYCGRAYKGRTFYNLEDAKVVLPEAIDYYSGGQYAKYFKEVVIESRKVTEWEAI